MTPAEIEILTKQERKLLWPAIVAIGTALALNGCAASNQSQKLDNGFVVFHTRGGVEFGDCGTQQTSWLFDPANKFVTSHSERGEALHCPLLGAVIQSGSHVGAAALLAQGAQKAAKAAASASNTLEINNVNGQSQGQSQVQTQSAVNTATGGAGGQGGHGDNGFGNGSHDGSPNGRPDNDR